MIKRKMYVLHWKAAIVKEVKIQMAHIPYPAEDPAHVFSEDAAREPLFHFIILNFLKVA